MSAARPEEVWKVLYDPARLPEWFVGVERVRTDGPDAYTMWPEGYPDFPMQQQIRLEDRRASVGASLRRLVDLAATASPPAPG